MNTDKGLQKKIRRASRLAAVLLLALFSPAMAMAAPVAVRGGDHEGYSRIVFDWPALVPYAASMDGDSIVLTFDSADDPKLDGLARQRLINIRAVSARRDADRVTVRVQTAVGVGLRHFRDGRKVVVDALVPRPAMAKPETASPAVGEDAPKLAEIAALGRAAAQMNAADHAAAVRRAEAAEAAAEKAKAEAAAAARAEAEAKAAAEEEEARRQAEAAAQAAEQAALVAQAPQHLVVGVRPLQNGVLLRYPWARTVAAAAFKRGAQLWVVFEALATVDHGALVTAMGERIRDATQVPHQTATILRYRIRVDQNVGMRREGTQWVVEVKDTLVRPRQPMTAVRQLDPRGGARLFINLEEGGATLIADDPEVGDRLFIVPVVPSGRGLAEEQRFAEFELLASAQGVAVSALSDHVLVERDRDGVVIATGDGLEVSGKGREDAVEEIAPAPATRIFDFEAWRALGGSGETTQRYHHLLYALSRARKDARNARRWDLARFLLAGGRATDAYGVLAVMGRDEPALEDSAEFRAVRGVAALNLRRYDEAAGDLAMASLDDEPDAYLWRALVAEAQGQPQAALDAFRRGTDVISLYSHDDRARFSLAAMRAALALGENEFVERELALLETLTLSPHRRAEAQFLQARLSQAYADVETAKATYARLSDEAPRHIAARARFEAIKLATASGAITLGEAINGLERLRYAWRGDEFELDLLERLGELYIATGDYRTGLEALRQAVSYFADSTRTRAIARRMEAIFRDLFLSDKTQAMEPLQALALYYDFRELTPLGAEGDTMVRRLADRMVAVDLLDRAAGLLEHQVKYRLEGVAQADVATRLAMIHLMNGRASDALGVLRATRNVAAMPEDLRRRRRQLEARALIDLGQFAEAESLLEEDATPQATLLRADLYWGDKAWTKVVAASGAVLGERWRDDAPLGEDERRHLLRIAVALAMTDDKAGLRQLRQQYAKAMASGALSEAFDVITNTGTPNPRDLKAAVASLADIDRLQSFLASYRDALSQGGASQS
ncbi:MAG: hypothetical protein ACOY99_02885 [Pseudomonadota bacterium]